MGAVLRMASGDKKDGLSPIGENQAFAVEAKKLARFQREIAETRKQIEHENARWYGNKTAGQKQPNAVQVAEQMLRGEIEAEDLDHSKKIRSLNRRSEVIQKAAFAQGEIVEKLRGELSVDAGNRVRPQHRKALGDMLVAARALAAASAAERAIRLELLENGYTIHAPITPNPQFGIALAMGDECWFDSPLANFRRWLQSLGVET